ncbi:SafA/ExsA family spore coat assembly protein [Evansella sp. AB-P1]|uniref:SafA/ExsA family spore coat assembly protein n=1 Tax=Evansella sp. AB-P1 TaxID=3037653 RepID=UPI0024200FFD|nr:SafA/ExsA family spore coat assembly protein [Evansella sp. AB-P1]MDG5786427.1 SafA/ExsA family spore coat assembly protein [Evansella sp. AB-P1]
MRIHIVQKGDTLWKLAQKYGVDFEELKAVNDNLSNPDLIMPGMKIKIPTGSVQAKKEYQKENLSVNFGTQEKAKKEQPKAKEVPVKEKTPPPSIKEEKEAPIPVPTPPKVPMKETPSYHMHKTDMNFNIYKQKAAPIPAPPKMPKQKEAPTVKKPVEKQPKPVETKQPMPVDCYPVPPMYQQGCYPCPPYYGYPAYPGVAPVPAHPYQHGGHVSPQPMQQPMQHQPGAPAPHPHGFYGEVDKTKKGNKEQPDVNYDTIQGYGDVTAVPYQQPHTPYFPMPVQTHHGHGVNQYMQPYMHTVPTPPQNPMQPNYPSQQGYGWREEDNEEGQNE